MSTCIHTIGIAESDGYEFEVRADSVPDISVLHFIAHAFCPRCGAKITDEPAAYLARLEKVREDYCKRPPSTDPFVNLMERDAHRMIKAINQQPSGISELLKKGPLPEGVGFNWRAVP